MPGSLPHTLFRVLEHDCSTQWCSRCGSLAHVVILSDLELEGVSMTLDEHLPVNGLPMVRVHTVAL